MQTRTATRPGERAGGRRGGRLRATAGILALLTLSGCTPDGNAATAAAQDFHQALAASNWSLACSMLEADTREKAADEQDGTCEERLQNLQLGEAGTVTGTEKFGRNALVTFENDAVFLAAVGSGWHVRGAGCEPRGEAPYICEVGGK